MRRGAPAKASSDSVISAIASHFVIPARASHSVVRDRPALRHSVEGLSLRLRAIAPHSVIPAKAGIHFALRRSREVPPSSFPRKRESILLVRLAWAERSSLLGFARHPWRASHFLCLHKESNQRNAPSVKRRPRSGRFAAVGRGLAAGLLPCRQMRAVLARTACGARGLFRPTFAASQRVNVKSSKGALSSAAGAALFFCFPGSPPGRGEQVEEKPEGSPAGCRRVCGQYRDVLPANPGACSRSHAGMDARVTAT